MPLHIAFVDLTKAFDLVSRSGLFKLLRKIGCPPHLLAIISSFHENMHSTVNYNSSSSEAFKVSSGVKQGCVLAPTLFGIFFSMLLQYAFMNCRVLHTRSDCKLLNIARLGAKTKVTKVLIREMLFADDTAVVSQTEEGLQQLVSRLSHACKEFGLKISLKKTNVMAQDAGHPPTIAIDGYNLEVVENFTYLGSTISNSLTEVLERANMMSIYTILCERQLCWLGHVKRMDPGRIPKDLLYGELAEGSRHAGRPKLRFKDVCKRDMKRCNIDSNSWESIADDRPSWRQTVKQGAKFAEEALTTAALDKWNRRREPGKYPQQPTPFSCTIVAETATHELVSTAIQGNADRLNYGATLSFPETDGCRRRRRMEHWYISSDSVSYNKR